MLQRYKLYEGASCRICLTYVAGDDRVVAAVARLPQGCWCANPIPHVTVAHDPRVGPAAANSMLKRALGDEARRPSLSPARKLEVPVWVEGVLTLERGEDTRSSTWWEEPYPAKWE